MRLLGETGLSRLAAQFCGLLGHPLRHVRRSLGDFEALPGLKRRMKKK
jgi:hypothetical protein